MKRAGKDRSPAGAIWTMTVARPVECYPHKKYNRRPHRTRTDANCCAKKNWHHPIFQDKGERLAGCTSPSPRCAGRQGSQKMEKARSSPRVSTKTETFARKTLGSSGRSTSAWLRWVLTLENWAAQGWGRTINRSDYHWPNTWAKKNCRERQRGEKLSEDSTET